MEVLTILISIAGICGIGYLTMSLHNYTMTKYQYTPFSKQNGIVTFVLAVMFVSIWFVLPEGQTIMSFSKLLIQLEVPDDSANALVLLAVVVIGLAGLGLHISRHSNPWIAMYSTSIMFCVSVIVLIIIIALWLWREADKAEKRKRRARP